ncbi:MAG: hypothetical protein V8R21_06045 [Dysosmobacter sp.]
MSEEALKPFEDVLTENRVFEFCDTMISAVFYGEFGVIFLVDEIQLYMNSLEAISTLKSSHRSPSRGSSGHIIATSQVFGRMASRSGSSSRLSCSANFWLCSDNALLDRDSLESDDSTGTNISGEVKDSLSGSTPLPCMSGTILPV